jgi:hypothetical protein
MAIRSPASSWITGSRRPPGDTPADQWHSRSTASIGDRCSGRVGAFRRAAVRAGRAAGRTLRGSILSRWRRCDCIARRVEVVGTRDAAPTSRDVAALGSEVISSTRPFSGSQRDGEGTRHRPDRETLLLDDDRVRARHRLRDGRAARLDRLVAGSTAAARRLAWSRWRSRAPNHRWDRGSGLGTGRSIAAPMARHPFEMPSRRGHICA